jgi:hypothetical protein
MQTTGIGDKKGGDLRKKPLDLQTIDRKLI